MKITVTYEGKTYPPFDPDSMRLSEMDVCEASYGWGLKSWLDALEDIKPNAVRFLVWVLKHRDGQTLDLASFDLALRDLDIDIDNTETPDPTSEAATASDDGSTSDSSPTS